MAKKQIRSYIFTPGAAGVGTIQVPMNIEQDQLLIITNTSKNVILYNFADTTYQGTGVLFVRANLGTSFPTLLDTQDGYTTITLQVSTVGQSSSDNLQIFYEAESQEIRPWNMGTDAFERMRVASPKSMIDADFEYGLQPTKWQVIDMLRGYPSIYEIPGTDTLVTTVTTDASTGTGGVGASLITVTCQAAHGFIVSTPVTIKGYLNSVTGFARAEGTFVINSIPATPNIAGSPTTFTYYAKAKVGTSNGDVLSTTYTQLRKGAYYTGASIGTPTFTYSTLTSPNTITVTFGNNHGLVPGDTITTVVNSDNGINNHTLAGGPFFVETVPSLNSLTFTARATGTVTGTITGLVYTRPDCFYTHRPFDGGVLLGTGSPAHGAQAIRQSKKYIRYQSGKAVNYNTGALFAPNYDLRACTAAGTIVGSVITVTTDDVDHGCQVGATIRIAGVTTVGYDGTYVVATVVDERSLTVLATRQLASTTGAIGSPSTLSVVNWYGATVRAGTFDDQNGMFWQFDGQAFSLGRRSSTFQTAGTISINTDSSAVTGTQTRFTSQLVVGDRVVIRGMSHVVSSITSDTVMTVTPDFRGAVNVSNVKMVKTIDYIIPQNKWNVDRLDGTSSVFNPSGYLIDQTKMQMIGMQWTWYGAGFIDWMLRGPEGKYIFVHRLRNNNLNQEAYMRSGNQPVRYEVENVAARSSLLLSNSIGTSDTVIPVTDLSSFPHPPAGYPAFVYIDNELISYTAKSATSGSGNLTGCLRAQTMNVFTAGSTRGFTAGPAASHAAGAGIILVGQTATPQISHWGSAFLSDGGFDEDRGYLFSYQAINIAINTKKTTAFAIRLAPSVSNAIIGDLGVRELINRAQLLLQSIAITAGGSANTNSALVIEGVLNPQNYPVNVANITWNSLSSPAIPTGQPSFAQIATGTSVTFENPFTLNTTTSGAAINATIIPVASTLNIAIGDDIFSTSVTDAFQGNSRIISFIANSSVTIDKPLIKALSNTNNVQITRNTYAVPGETVFSFLNSPNGTDKLELDTLKELTNTPIGGRGTFPNGPDVLFINVYITQGVPILSNLILRWGEAQA
jgi:hypothetical protein